MEDRSKFEKCEIKMRSIKQSVGNEGREKDKNLE